MMACSRTRLQFSSTSDLANIMNRWALIETELGSHQDREGQLKS